MAPDRDLVAAAQGLAPRIRARRADIEHQRRLPPELVAAMHELKLFRLFIPSELGGLETDPLTAAWVVEQAFAKLAAVKTASAGSGKPVAERGMAQVNVARAEAALLSARGFLYDTAGGIWDDVESGRAPDARQLAIARLARINAIAAAALAVDLVYEAGGGSSIYTSSPLERCLRDIRTASQHVSMATANYEIIGRVLLGLPPDRPAHRL